MDHSPSTPAPIRQVAPPATRGYVLIATLALLTLLVASVVIVVQITHIRNDLTDARSHQTAAREHALLAIDIAIAQLQQTAGPDRILTAPAATLFDSDPSTPEWEGVFHPYWTQVIDPTLGTRTWLLSSRDTPDPTRALDTNHAITVVGEGSVGPNRTTLHVQVPKVALTPADSPPGRRRSSPGAYAYWTGELNTRANVTLTDAISPILTGANRNDYLLSYLQLAQPRRSAIESLLPSFPDPESPSNRLTLNSIFTTSQLFYPLREDAPLQNRFHDLTTTSFTLLTNPLTGGLKINLSDPTYTDALITPAIRQLITPTFYTSAPPEAYRIPANAAARALPLNLRPNPGEPLAIQQPILTEFCLSMGIFHTQSDRRHRLRYHMHAEWLNPYPYPMAFPNARAFIIVADGLPTLEVTNQSSGQRFTVNLNNFDTNLFNNDANESKIHSWMEFAPIQGSGMGNQPPGIDSGRFYRMSEPSKTDQPQGLARTVAEDPHRWQWGGGAPPANAPRADNTIYGNDTIRIRSTTSPVRMNLLVIPIEDGERIPEDTHPDAFAAARGYALHFENVPFDSIDITLSGSNYSRSTSGSFNPNDYRLAFHFKLNEENPDRFRVLAEQLSPRSPVIDFSDSRTRSIYEIKDVAAAARSADPLTEQERFWDDSERANTALGPEEYQLHLYDVPVLEPVSPGVFSQLHFHQRPHPWVGSRSNPPNPLNEVYDRYFFTGAVLSASWQTRPLPWSASAHAGGLLTNTRLRPIPQADGSLPTLDEVTTADAAAHLWLEGGFNLFSASVPAWVAFLQGPYLNNSALTIHHAGGDTRPTPHVFARLPFGSANIPELFADSALPETSDPNRLLYRQGVRVIDGDGSDPEAAIHALAVGIVTRIRQAVSGADAATFPITSLRDFIQSGLIDDAISASSPPINHGLDALNPAYLRQADLFARLGDRLTLRSDTFVIRAYGESNAARSGQPRARAWCEAIVQRFPEYVIATEPPTHSPSLATNAVMGRRFRVLQFRWLQPHEI